MESYKEKNNFLEPHINVILGKSSSNYNKTIENVLEEGKAMISLLNRSFDLSIRAMELIRYLKEENKPFPLYERFLICTTGIGISLRHADLSEGELFQGLSKALTYVIEVEYLLETMVKTGYLQIKQSQPMMNDCRVIKKDITELIRKGKERPSSSFSIGIQPSD